MKSIAKSIIDLDGDECYVTEIEPWQIYEALLNYLCGNNKAQVPSLKLFIEVLDEIKKILWPEYINIFLY